MKDNDLQFDLKILLSLVDLLKVIMVADGFEPENQKQLEEYVSRKIGYVVEELVKSYALENPDFKRKTERFFNDAQEAEGA
jgi:hypothetical protein